MWGGRSFLNKSSSYTTFFIYSSWISRYTAADAWAAATSKPPSQLWRWSQTFMWGVEGSASQLQLNKTENPIKCWRGREGREQSFKRSQLMIISFCESGWTLLRGDGRLFKSQGVVCLRVRARGSVTQKSAALHEKEVKWQEFPFREESVLRPSLSQHTVLPFFPRFTSASLETLLYGQLCPTMTLHILSY